MHARLRVADLDDLGLAGGEFVQPIAHDVLRLEVAGQADVGGMVAGFRLEEAAVKVAELRGGDVVGQKRKPLAAASLDQAGDEQPVDGSLRLGLPDKVVQPWSVAARRELFEANAAPLEQVEHEPKVLEFLVHDLRHRPGERHMVDVGKKQVHRHACGLLLAVGVVDEHIIEASVDLGEPAGGGGGLEAQHGWSLCGARDPGIIPGMIAMPPSDKPPARKPDRNVLGGPLVSCSSEPLTGFFRDGCCRTGPADEGVHTVCAVMTADFLRFTVTAGNDLVTPRPEWGFPGLVAGDRWCLCAARWLEAARAGRAPPVVLEATHEKSLDVVPFELLKKHAAPQA